MGGGLRDLSQGKVSRFDVEALGFSPYPKS